jgi:hypothetical protein
MAYMTPWWAFLPFYSTQEERKLLRWTKESLESELKAVIDRLSELERIEKQSA